MGFDERVERDVMKEKVEDEGVRGKVISSFQRIETFKLIMTSILKVIKRSDVRVGQRIVIYQSSL